MDSRAYNDGSHAKAGQSSHHHPAPTKAELMSSAKLLGGAAKAKLHHEPNKADKAELAGAAADLLNAASHYGKMEEKGMGKYVGKAEDYLHKYHTSHSQTAAAAGSAHHSAAAAQHAHSSGHSGGNQGDHHSGGYGEYIKMAEGIFKKHSSHESSTTTAGHSHSENKYGEYAKMAGDFLKKH